MIENFQQWLERDTLRWEESIRDRELWIKRGWVAAETVSQEMDFFRTRAANSWFLLTVLCV